MRQDKRQFDWISYHCRKLVIGIGIVCLFGCSGATKITDPGSTRLSGDDILVVFSLQTHEKFVEKNKIPDSCIVKKECMKRYYSYYQMRDASNQPGDEFFEIADALHVVKIAPGASRSYYLQYTQADIHNPWIASTPLLFESPAAGGIYYLGRIHLSPKIGQTYSTPIEHDSKRFYAKFPQFKQLPLKSLRVWRNEKDQQATAINMAHCGSVHAVTMLGGTASIDWFLGPDQGCRPLMNKSEDYQKLINAKPKPPKVQRRSPPKTLYR